jgi:CDGSH-type Zn-finger protein/uncharacterized Fe-S cluster protein YjdI
MTNPLVASTASDTTSREQLLHLLYEAAELEHNLMCTYLYAAFSLKSGDEGGLVADEAAAVVRWRRAILDVAIAEMSHLVAVWNITSALGGTPRFGRTNFPLDPGFLPAGVVVKLAPFSATTLQHFVHLERPTGSDEPDGEGYAYERHYRREVAAARLTPMASDYVTVGQFYEELAQRLRNFVARVGEDAAFCGDRTLQLSPAEVMLPGAKRVICLKSAIASFDAIVIDGEGAPSDTSDSHFRKFLAIRDEFAELNQRTPAFAPAYPAATNPVLRRPPRPEGRVWIENELAGRTVDLANASYGLMLRLMGHAYATRHAPEKSRAVDLAIGLMKAMTFLGEAAARLPAGPSNPECHAGMSFTALRDAAPLPTGRALWRFVSERFQELTQGLDTLIRSETELGSIGTRLTNAARALNVLRRSAEAAAGEWSDTVAPSAPPAPAPAAGTPVAGTEPAVIENGIETVEGQALTLMFEAKRCIHARFCVTGAPEVFLANVQGPWIHPDAMDTERLADIAHVCPSGAIQYRRKDGRPNEPTPPVNLAAIREAGPYAFRGDLRLRGNPIGTRATLCRCGASKNKPFCDGSHHDAGFSASGEPPTGTADMLTVRNGPLQIDPQMDVPLAIRGNLEITSGTGRVVARVTTAVLCRCGGSKTKPFCDGSHRTNGFQAE